MVIAFYRDRDITIALPGRLIPTFPFLASKTTFIVRETNPRTEGCSTGFIHRDGIPLAVRKIDDYFSLLSYFRSAPIFKIFETFLKNNYLYPNHPIFRKKPIKRINIS